MNKLDEESIGRILWKYGEERLYKKIAHGIVYFRNDHGPIKTTKQLADVIATIVKQYVVYFYIIRDLANTLNIVLIANLVERYLNKI